MTDEEWAEKKKIFVTRRDDIKTQEQILECMVKLQQTPMPKDQRQFKYVLVPDYSETHSLQITCSHHSMIDGQGLSAYYKLIAGSTAGSDIPALPV